MSLPTLCIQRPVMTTALTLAIVLVGLAGYPFLPVDGRNGGRKFALAHMLVPEAWVATRMGVGARRSLAALVRQSNAA